MRISNGSERGRFQRTYKNNGSGAGEKLKHTFYYGNPLIFFLGPSSKPWAREQGGYRGVLYLDCLQVQVAGRLEPTSTRPEAWWPRRMTGSAASCNEAKLDVYVTYGVHPLSC